VTAAKRLWQMPTMSDLVTLALVDAWTEMYSFLGTNKMPSTEWQTLQSIGRGDRC